MVAVDGAPVRGIVPAALHRRLWAREGRKVEPTTSLERGENAAAHLVGIRATRCVIPEGYETEAYRKRAGR